MVRQTKREWISRTLYEINVKTLKMAENSTQTWIPIHIQNLVVAVWHCCWLLLLHRLQKITHTHAPRHANVRCAPMICCCCVCNMIDVENSWERRQTILGDVLPTGFVVLCVRTHTPLLRITSAPKQTKKRNASHAHTRRHTTHNKRDKTQHPQINWRCKQHTNTHRASSAHKLDARDLDDTAPLCRTACCFVVVIKHLSTTTTVTAIIARCFVLLLSLFVRVRNGCC